MSARSSKGKVSRRKFLSIGAGAAIAAVAIGGGYYIYRYGAPGVKGAPVRIGFVTGLTGPYSGNCKKMLDGAKLAVKEVNEEGGVLGRPLEMIIRDDEFSPGTAVRRVAELVETAKIEMLTGTLGTHILHAINDYSKKNKLLYFGACICVVATKMADTRSPWTYFTFPSTVAIMRSGAEYAATLAKKWYLIYPDYSAGVEMSGAFKERLLERGCEILGVDAAPLGGTDFSPFLTRARAAKPEGLAMCGQLGTDLMNILKQAKGFGMDKEMAIFSGNNTLTDSRAMGQDVISGVYTFLDFYWKLDVDAVRKYSEPYVKEYGEVPDTYSIGSYIGIKEWAKAVNSVGTTNIDRVKEELDGARFDLCKGPMWIRDWDGQIIQDMFFIQGRKPDDPIVKENSWDMFEFKKAVGGEGVYLTKKELGYA